MPRVARDSEEDSDLRNSVRRTRASSAANSVTDSPVARRTTRSNKQLSTIESSPESLDDNSTPQPLRATRSRTATLDKSSVLTRNLRSRKNSASSDQSESIVDTEAEVTQRRVTRKTVSALSAAGTPTKVNLRSRGIRAGSEVKSTPPPARTKRVTRASSVDPVSLNESTGTPAKRHTRASIVSVQPTVTEEQEAKNKAYKSLDNISVEIEDVSDKITSKKEKSSKKSKLEKESEENLSTVNMPINNSEKSSLEILSNFPNRQRSFYEPVEESTIKSFTIYSHGNTIVETSTSNSKTNINFNETIDLKSPVGLEHITLLKKLNDLSDTNDKIELESTKNNISVLNSESKSNNDEHELINVEDSAESSFTDDLIIQVDSPEKDGNRAAVDNFKVGIKDPYVKLNRANVIEQILNEKVENSKNSIEDSELIASNNLSQNSVITNTKTAIVLMKDIVKSNDNIPVKLTDSEKSLTSVGESNTDNLNIVQQVVIHSPQKENSVDTDEARKNTKVDACLSANVNVIHNNSDKLILSDTDIYNDQKFMPVVKPVIKKSSVILNDLSNDKKFSTLINKTNNQSEECIDKENKNEENCEKSMLENQINCVKENLISVDENNDDLDHIMDVDTSNIELKNSTITLTYNDQQKNCVSVNQVKNTDTFVTTNTQFVSYDLEQKIDDELESITLVDEDSDGVEFVEAIDTSKNNSNCSLNVPKDNSESKNLMTNKNLSENLCSKPNVDEFSNSNAQTKSIIENKISYSIVNENEKMKDLKKFDNVSKNLIQASIIIDKPSNELKSLVHETNANKNLAIIVKENLPCVNVCDNGTKSFISENYKRDSLVNSSLSVEDTNGKVQDSTTFSQVNLEMNTLMPNDESNCPYEIPNIRESAHQVNKEEIDSDSIHEKTNITSITTVETACEPEVEIGEKSTEPVLENGANNACNGIMLESAMDNPLNHFNSHDETENLQTNSETNQIQPKLYEGDKNSLSSAVTDTDGREASPLQKPGKKKSSKEQIEEKPKRKIASESDEENLFQDVLPEEYAPEKSVDTTFEKLFDGEVSNKSAISDRSSGNGTLSQELNDSLKKKNRKSIADSQISEDSGNKTVTENAGINDENKSLKKDEQSANKSLGLNQSSSKQQKDESISEKLLDSSTEHPSLNKSRKSLDRYVKLNKSVTEQEKSDITKDSSCENKSSNKSRKSLDKSIKLSRSMLKDNHNESIPLIVDGNKSTNKGSEALDIPENMDKSMSESKENECMSKKLSSSFNDSKSSKRQSLTNVLHKSLSENKIEEPIEDEPMDIDDEPMEVDEISNQSKMEDVKDKSLNKTRRSLDKSQLNKSINENTSAKLSTSLNNSKSISPVKNRKSLPKEDSQDKNASIKDGLDASLSDSKTGKILSKTLESPKMFTRKSLIIGESEEIFSDNESETNEDASTYHNKSKDLRQSHNTAKPKTISSEIEDKSLREKSLRKSLNKSIIASNTDSSNSEVEDGENDKKLCKSANKSLNDSKKNLKSVNISLVSSPAKASITANGEDLDISYLKKNESSENTLDESIKKSIERMKYSNPMKHSISTVAEVDSESCDENLQRIFEADSEGFEESDDEEKEKTSVDENDSEDEDENSTNLDSDIEREYNLQGKNISKYSDDDIPGDDCRASEEEFSDSEDEGDDLEDFVVSDEECEGESEDEDECDEANEEVDDNQTKSSEERELNEMDIKKGKSKSTKDKTINDSKSFKNKSADLSKSQLLEIVNSESDDNDDANKVSNEDNKSLKDKSANSSKLLKNNSLNNSEIVKDKSKNLSKSILSTSQDVLNNSKSMKNKLVTISEAQPSDESDLETEDFLPKLLSSSTESDSASEKEEDSYYIVTSEPVNPSESEVQNKKLSYLIECSTPKPGFIKKNTNNFVDKNGSLSNVTNQSSSTRRKSVSLDNLTETKLINSRISIGSTNHDSSKIQDTVEAINSPESLLKNRQPWKLVPLNKTMQSAGGETPVTKYLKKTKLNDSVPVLQSMRSGNLADNEEPKKKTTSNSSKRENLRLNDSVPILESMKSSGLFDSEGFKKKDDSKSSKRKSLPNRKLMNVEDETAAAEIEDIDKKSKKRKLRDISHIASLDDESVINIVGKKKKRARIEESTVQDEDVEQTQETDQDDEGKKKKKKKNKNNSVKEQQKRKESIEESIVPDEEVEQMQKPNEFEEGKKKKKKKNKNNSVEEPEKRKEIIAIEEKDEEALEFGDGQKSKKKKKNKSVDTADNGDDVLVTDTVKCKKKKLRLSEEKVQQELELAVQLTRSKKKKSRSSEERSDQENFKGEVEKTKKKSKRRLDSEPLRTDKKSKKKNKVVKTESDDDEGPEDVGFEDAKRTALISVQQAASCAQATKVARKKKHQEHIELMHKQECAKKRSLERLSEDILGGLADQPAVRQPYKRQKLSKNKERSLMMPSTSMFSPGKPVPANLKVDDDYIGLSDAGGTTQFGVVSLAKASKAKVSKSSIAALNFRQKMLARNQREPVSAYHVYLKKQKAKSGI